MCGISGIYCFGNKAVQYADELNSAVKAIKLRGPDGSGVFIDKNIGIGHTRLAINDISEAGKQPFFDNTGRYHIVFNGEIYNYKEYQNELSKDGINFVSNSDTEVLLYLLIKYGEKALNKLNGFFAFAFYDSKKNTCIIARDRMGIKPLHYYKDREKIIFASELKGVLAWRIPKEIDYTSLTTYFQLNYLPTQQSILKNVYKLTPGTFLIVSQQGIEQKEYYKIPVYNNQQLSPSYSAAKTKLYSLIENSVKLRLTTDTTLGCFLSGGIDSSIITALAAQHTNKLNTFALGFTDNKYFDETKYAELVAKKYNTNHTVFKVSNDDLLQGLNSVLDYIDEPFADSSALAVNILCKLTQQNATVILSGDGADELFSGYNKHKAHYNARYAGTKEKMLAAMNPVWKVMPKSRNSKQANLMRQFNKFATGFKIAPADRYLFWASIASDDYTNSLLKNKVPYAGSEFLKQHILNPNIDYSEINNVLYADLHLVLQGDMLTKVDLMSMANSVEVRVPFLDYTVVDFVAGLPASYKISSTSTKKILKDTFAQILPTELINRPKHGFEVPLLNWFKNELWQMIDNDLLNSSFIEEQGIFEIETINFLKKKLFSSNPEDTPAKIWALIVFQHWWKKYFNN
ncbi:MAG: asparagine synthase (glutamine-hydrolyzing) [Bacteroidales bacterium]|nr:asparagine synthase (glutamine-hydrolyzing) [Bacteroidales bacterium]